MLPIVKREDAEHPGRPTKNLGQAREHANRPLEVAERGRPLATATSSSVSTCGDPPAPRPAMRNRRIASSTMLHENSSSNISLFDDVSLLASSGIPTMSSGTMKVLGPIIEFALLEDDPPSTNCKALVLYVPRQQWIDKILNISGHDAVDENQLALVPYIGPDHRSFQTPTREVLPLSTPPNAPKKHAASAIMYDVENAFRRLTLDQAESNPSAISGSVSLENIDSSENFDTE